MEHELSLLKSLQIIDFTSFLDIALLHYRRRNAVKLFVSNLRLNSLFYG